MDAEQVCPPSLRSRTTTEWRAPGPGRVEREQDADLAALWGALKVVGDGDARKDLIARYWPLVRHTTRKLMKSLSPQASFDDLMGYGAEGLIEAVDRFDATRGVRFETYASHKIRSAVLDGIRSEDWAYRSVRHREREMREVRSRLWGMHGRPPTESEEAEALGMPLDSLRTVKQAIARAEVASLDVDHFEEVRAAGAQFDDEPLRTCLEAERRAQLHRAVANLSPRERAVVNMSFDDGLTLAQIGDRLNVTESRACQIRMAAIRRLRDMLPSLSEEQVGAGV